MQQTCAHFLPLALGRSRKRHWFPAAALQGSGPWFSAAALQGWVLALGFRQLRCRAGSWPLVFGSCAGPGLGSAGFSVAAALQICQVWAAAVLRRSGLVGGFRGDLCPKAAVGAVGLAQPQKQQNPLEGF